MMIRDAVAAVVSLAPLDNSDPFIVEDSFQKGGKMTFLTLAREQKILLKEKGKIGGGLFLSAEK